MTTTIDHREAYQLLERAVDTRGGDYVDKQIALGISCRYVDLDRKPGCIAGLALRLAGVPISTLTEMDRGGGWVSHSRVNAVLVTAGFVLTDEAQSVFSAAQHAQDNGQTWSVALESARGTLNELNGGM